MHHHFQRTISTTISSGSNELSNQTTPLARLEKIPLEKITAVAPQCGKTSIWHEECTEVQTKIF